MEESHPTTSSDITDNHEDDCKVTWIHPSHIFQRLIALLLMCLIGFGNIYLIVFRVVSMNNYYKYYLLFLGSYFCFDNPGALQDNFIQDMNLTTSQFVYLYSWYSWPNVVMCFIGGFLIDRF